MSTLLEAIVARKRREVEVARERVPTMALEGRMAVAPPVRDFFAAVAAPGAIRLIAEFKRKSPSAGDLRPDATIEEIVRGYAAAGAAALSVLTDAVGFGGSLVDLESARVAVPLPVLRKEFVVDRYQVL
jgi:indole-3-glycerol phosphate synthase